MKNPNGYGSVYKLPGNRRKPWAVRLTVSTLIDSAGAYRMGYKYLGYYETKEKALIALALYNEHPYSLDSNKVTFSDVFERWQAEKFPKISTSNQHGYLAAYAACADLQGLRFAEIRKAHLQGVIDTCGKNYPTLKKIRCLFHQVFKYAMENDLCIKDYSKYVDLTAYSDRNPNALAREPFTPEEISRLWDVCSTNDYYTVILMLIYTGVRISELLNLKKADVHLQDRYFNVIQSKTKAGIRSVPIAAKLLPFFQYWMTTAPDCPHLISTPDGEHFKYHNYFASYWMPLLAQIGMDSHRPHDTRHTCITMMNNAGISEKIQKRIVGHKGQGVTDVVYTHYEILQLLEAIDKI